MKDFYKILGVKETASEEEIRARWVELTKHYHPDRGEDIASNEKIREINEAYQILKHSSTRVEYDLKRTYGPQKREGKRGSYFKKLGIPAGILIIVIIFSVLYFKNFQNEINQRNQTNETNQTNLPRQSRSESVRDEMRSLFHWDQIDQTNQINQINQRNQIDQINQINQIDAPAQQPKIAKAAPAMPIKQDQKDQTAQINQRNQIDLPRQSRSESVRDEVGGLFHRGQINQIDVPVQQPKAVASTPALVVKQDQTDQIDLSRLPRKEAVRGEMPLGLLSHWDQTDQIDQKDLKIELAQFKPPSLLATEGEVKKFFDNYIEHYNQMDLEGFLSLFSSKAIQNKKDGLEGIRKVYTIFFNQGKEVRCRFRDMKIEIYQNVVEVKARYEIIQILINSENRGFWKGQIQWVLVKENEAFKIVSLDYQHD